jgi:hypothetical protein
MTLWKKVYNLKKTALSLIVLILLFSSTCLFSDTKVTGDPMVKITGLPKSLSLTIGLFMKPSTARAVRMLASKNQYL